jgi:hypothetical protein
VSDSVPVLQSLYFYVAQPTGCPWTERPNNAVQIRINPHLMPC